ncbi:zonular occludens toxin domain-containing protein, partial [Enterocloster bolteae]|uniref:zonular occludens toxin domain-containing protein n=1 Tax=Enterocloster bolteae TaxID=208479 RepID=UPI002A841C3E
MIVLYSGTPGSGKSLDTSRTIYNWCRRGAPIICNFPVNVNNIKVRKKKNFHYVPNSELDPDKLVEFSHEYFSGNNCKENSILLVIDEAQLLFNARDWSVKGRDRWNWFFTMHRHFGYFIILCAQFDRMLDRQVRGLIEYEYVHRKVNNMGWRGVLFGCLLLSPVGLFVKVKVWYPMKEKVSSE